MDNPLQAVLVTVMLIALCGWLLWEAWQALNEGDES